MKVIPTYGEEQVIFADQCDDEKWFIARRDDESGFLIKTNDNIYSFISLETRTELLGIEPSEDLKEFLEEAIKKGYEVEMFNSLMDFKNWIYETFIKTEIK